MTRVPVENLADDRLAPYRDLKSHRLKQRTGTFVVEGASVVQRMLEAGWQAESILISDWREPEHEGWLPENVVRYVVPHDLVHELVGFKFHAGLLACGLRRPNPRLDSWLPSVAGGCLVVAAADVVDPENTGGLIRASSAFGVTALLLGEGCADPFSRRVLRVSMGNGFRLPIREARSLEEDLAWLRAERGLCIVATVLERGAEPLNRFVRPERMALIFGNERHGIPARILAMCDRGVTIPMRRGTDSLNVSVAAAVFLHHLDPGVEL